MNEEDAVKLLGKLEKFMTDTTKTIQAITLVVGNQQVEIDKLKKELSKSKSIFLPH